MNPFIRHAWRSGQFIGDLTVPSLFNMRRDQKTGPRFNLSFEGLTFARDGQSLWVAMEAPLRQDGDVPTPLAGAMARLTQYSRDGRALW